jgi:hypothetical protein
MNTIDFSHTGGFPLETDTLDFLQKSLAEPIQALAVLGGDNYILSGVIENDGKVADGWMVIDGEVLPFKGGFKQSTIIINTIPKTADFEDGANRQIYFTRYATFGTGLKSIAFASLPFISDLQQQKKKDAELQAAHNALKDRVVKLEKAQIIPGMIMAWSGSINSIPAGWQLCKALKDKFILGAGGDFPVGKIGGESRHRLTEDEMPSHYHKVDLENILYAKIEEQHATEAHENKVYTRDYFNPETHTNYAGSDRPHNNMPPYYALAYIEYVGF